MRRQKEGHQEPEGRQPRVRSLFHEDNTPQAAEKPANRSIQPRPARLYPLGIEVSAENQEEASRLAESAMLTIKKSDWGLYSDQRTAHNPTTPIVVKGFGLFRHRSGKAPRQYIPGNENWDEMDRE